MGEDARGIQDHAWDEALHLLGTSAIFEERARKLKFHLKGLKVLGIVVPVLVGGSAATFGAKWDYLHELVVVTGVVGLAQLVWSTFALALGWDDQYANAKEAQQHNKRLSDDYRKIAEKLTSATPEQIAKHEQRLELLDLEKSWREQLDLKADISDQEKRFGMRVGLYNFRRKCVTCDAIPNPSAPTGCHTCGK